MERLTVTTHNKKEAAPRRRGKQGCSRKACIMHTQHVTTPPAAIYWTTQAQEVFDDEIKAVVSQSWTPGGQIVVGNHASRITAIARRQGSERVNRNMVQEYFARLADRGAK